MPSASQPSEIFRRRQIMAQKEEDDGSHAFGSHTKLPILSCKKRSFLPVELSSGLVTTGKRLTSFFNPMQYARSKLNPDFCLTHDSRSIDRSRLHTPSSPSIVCLELTIDLGVLEKTSFFPLPIMVVEEHHFTTFAVALKGVVVLEARNNLCS